MNQAKKELTNTEIFAPLIFGFFGWAFKIGLAIWAFSENPLLATIGVSAFFIVNAIKEKKA